IPFGQQLGKSLNQRCLILHRMKSANAADDDALIGNAKPLCERQFCTWEGGLKLLAVDPVVDDNAVTRIKTDGLVLFGCNV
ncbi:hypothetical protein, partial [Mesorhizobium sp. M3A.F.Ca.ET.201.01.1.1]|uniref:hypothetical protein n=1 Tax=Mesorhizobium sp. M3A.F.Ca.ET.201.01.1.1 TaxID=2563946 RepID=UPI00167249B8